MVDEVRHLSKDSADCVAVYSNREKDLKIRIKTETEDLLNYITYHK